MERCLVGLEFNRLNLTTVIGAGNAQSNAYLVQMKEACRQVGEVIEG